MSGAAPHVLASAETLAQVVELSADAIYTEDRDGRVTSWNAAAERLYGVSAREVLGRPLVDVLLDFGQELQAARDAARTGTRTERFERSHRRADGELVEISVTVSPLREPDGGFGGVATSAADVTERVVLARALQQAHDELERREVVLLRSNRDLEQFAYVASHDLSEPLRVISGYVQLLQKRYLDELDERGERYVRHVVEGCERMRALIDDLLEYSRFLRIDHAIRPVDTGDVLAGALARLESQVSAAGADVRLHALPPVMSDPVALGALFQNLLSNAVKFARPGSPARVEVSGVRQDDRVVVHVDDDGIGIDPAFRDKVFRMFQRLHLREDYPGTGIGLAVVHKVAEQSGGSVWIEDSPLGGARFCVSLQAADAAELGAGA